MILRILGAAAAGFLALVFLAGCDEPPMKDSMVGSLSLRARLQYPPPQKWQEIVVLCDEVNHVLIYRDSAGYGSLAAVKGGC